MIRTLVHLWSTNNPTKTTNTATSCGDTAGQTTNKDNTVTVLRQRVSKVRILPGAPSPASTPGSARTGPARWSTNGPHSIRSLRRRLADAAAIAVLFIPLYVLAVLMDWDDRRHGVTR